MADAKAKTQTEAERIAAMREEIADFERKANDDAVKYADKLLKPVQDFCDSEELAAVVKAAEEARIASVQFPQLNSMISSISTTIDAIKAEANRAHQQAVTEKVADSGAVGHPA